MDHMVQCMSVSIIDDSEDEQDRECFAVTISTSDIKGVTLDTTKATICITDNDGNIDIHKYTNLSFETFFVFVFICLFFHNSVCSS